MKSATTLLFAALFLFAAPAVFADEAPSATIEPVPVETQAADVQDETLATPAQDCSNTETLLEGTVLQETTPASQTCGSCSSSGCRGAIRGQFCYTGSGWGNCNIFSGGYMCPEGGWDCQCSSGDLP